LLCELSDVARKDCHKEKCGQQSDLLTVTLNENQAEPEQYFNHTRSHDHEVGFEWQPGWNLGQELAAVGSQVTCAGEGQGDTEKDAGNVAKCIHLHKVAVSGRTAIQVPR